MQKQTLFIELKDWDFLKMKTKSELRLLRDFPICCQIYNHMRSRTIFNLNLTAHNRIILLTFSLSFLHIPSYQV